MRTFTRPPPAARHRPLTPRPENSKTDRRRHNLSADTARTISADHAGALANELPQADTMVLRLASGHGTHSFAFTVGNQAPVTLQHRDGKIEIDSVRIGLREPVTRSSSPAGLDAPPCSSAEALEQKGTRKPRCRVPAWSSARKADGSASNRFKRGPFDSIHRAKLAYAVWAVHTNIRDDTPNIPVYLRVTGTPHGVEFNVAE